MQYPNFIIGGAAKAGTTTLYKILEQHPQIFLTDIKEPQYFATKLMEQNESSGKPKYDGAKSVKDKKHYIELFSGVTNEIAVGEASTIYLHDSGSHKRILREVPNAKLIFILRNPTERAYSQFLHHVRDGRELVQEFEQALQTEEDRRMNGWGPFWSYKYSGLYYQQLKPYFDNFHEEQIKIIIFEEFIKDKSKYVKDILKFLKVQETESLELNIKSNATGYPKFGLLNNLLNNKTIRSAYRKYKDYIPNSFTDKIFLLRDLNLSKKPMDENVRVELKQFFLPDIKKLESLLEKDLKIWY